MSNPPPSNDGAKRKRVAHIRHELRTPLNAILGYSEMLMEEAEDLQDLNSLAVLKELTKTGDGILVSIDRFAELLMEPSSVENSEARERAFCELNGAKDQASGLAASLQNSSGLAGDSAGDIDQIVAACLKLNVMLGEMQGL